jgi:hypothetical protein
MLRPHVPSNAIFFYKSGDIWYNGLDTPEATMFTELITHLTIPHPAYVRQLGYTAEIIAMERRYERNRVHWLPHLENTRRFVLHAAERSANRDTAVVFGAGLLLDVPLEELSQRFGEVVLADVVVLPHIRRRAKRFANVQMVQHDVTGMAGKLHEQGLRGVRELPQPAPVMPPMIENAGLVVSLNILSQLWVVPRAYVLARLPGLDGEQVDDWCRQIVETHYAFLRSLPCTVCLVTDREFIQRDREGSIVRRGATLSGCALPEPDESWVWNIAPLLPGDRHYLSKELSVGAWCIA